MRTSSVATVVGAALALAACSDPELAIAVRYDDPELRDQLQSLTLAVVDLPLHPNGRPVACDEVRYGRISRDQLDGGRRASASVLSGETGVSGVPRLGEKLFILEGRDRAGDLIAGGCTARGDIEVDTKVEITAETVAIVRLLGQRGMPRDPSLAPGDFELGLYRPWKRDDAVVGLGRTVEVDLRDRAAERTQLTTATSCTAVGPGCPTAGVATVPIADIRRDLVPAISPGPVEIILHAPWAEEPLVVRAFEPLPMIATAVFLSPAGSLRAVNRAAPSWAVVRGGGGLRAAAIFVSGVDARVFRIVLIETPANQLVPSRREIVVNEPIYSLVAWEDNIWTRTASGWRRVNFAGAGSLEPGLGGLAEPATELIAIEPCQSGGPAALLMRAGDGPYVAYADPNRPHPGGAADPIAMLTARVNGFEPGRVLSAICVTYPAVGAQRTVIVRGEPNLNAGVQTLMLRVGSTIPLQSPIASGFLGYDDGAWRLAGAALGVTGPRLESYTLSVDAALGVDDGRLAGELTTLPTATSVADVDDEPGLDLVATSHEIVDESRIQITYLARDDRAALTGLSPPIRGIAPLVSVDHVAALDRWIITVATSDLFAMFDLGVR